MQDVFYFIDGHGLKKEGARLPMHKLVENWSRFSKYPKVRRRRSTKCANVSTGEMTGTEMGAKSFGPSLTTCSLQCT